MRDEQCKDCEYCRKPKKDEIDNHYIYEEDLICDMFEDPVWNIMICPLDNNKVESSIINKLPKHFRVMVKNMSIPELIMFSLRSLTNNIDAYYTRAVELIGTEKPHNLGFLKEKYKEMLESYLFLIKERILND